MAKRKQLAKRSITRLPKGLPIRSSDGSENPFDNIHQHRKRPKHDIVNRSGQNGNRKPSAESSSTALSRSIQQRREGLRATLKMATKANVFHDRRIGEYNQHMSLEDKKMARMMRERSRQSKRSTKFMLTDDDDIGDMALTHKGQRVDSILHLNYDQMSDHDDDHETPEGGNLDEIDTMMHFGGGNLQIDPNHDMSMYGPSNTNESDALNLSQRYLSRKLELDDFILRRKILKAEKQKVKEEQVETIDALDGDFAAISSLLTYRDKEEEIRSHIEKKRLGALSDEDKEFAEWDREMKQYQVIESKVQAVDRTKTPEEIAQEEADRLHELETRRLARMNGDFDDDDLSDISLNGGETNRSGKRTNKRKKSIKRGTSTGENAETLDDESDVELDVDRTLQTRFTIDGPVLVDKHGAVVNTLASATTDPVENYAVFAPGTRVSARYHATEQMGGFDAWFPGTVVRVHVDDTSRAVTYDIDYDDGDFEDGVQFQHIKILPATEVEKQKCSDQRERQALRLKAKQKAK
jgi:nucleolar protein 14